ncbi:MAG TPA: SpoIIE family protein phosphatase [Gemmatimonadaceae bacterium]|nr:SpoIIE family protein phosphatase [Gemmatimonadaceae bacterium]
MSRPTPGGFGIAPFVEWSVASRPKPGERTTGDLSLVMPHHDGTLVAVIDGLGHGEAAAEAADAARVVLAREPGDTAISHIKRCHDALVRTRGVAMSIATIDARRATLTWISVGNVEGLVVQSGPDGHASRSRLITRGGVVGSALPQLRAEIIPLAPGDLLVFATDGIDQRFADDFPRDARSADEIANGVLAQFAKTTDDALVLVARVGERG